MRYLLLLAAPALLLGAAQPLRRPANSGPTRATVALATPGAVLSNEARTALLARAGLGRLWQHQASNGTEDVLNGVFGYDGRRLEFVFLSVQPDAKKTGRYLVAGKFRCYGDVTPFRGSIEVQQVQRLTGELAREFENSGQMPVPTYCATGRFALCATSAHGLGGRFDGRVALDFCLAPNGKAKLALYTLNPATRHGGLLFDGAWRDTDAADAVPALWKQNIAVIHQVLKRFEIGDRDAHINPHYARVGWNTYWQNDEWWAEKQVAKR